MGLYTRFRALWQDGSAGGTPLTAAALNYIEDGIVAASDHGTLAGLGDDDHTQYLLRTDASSAYVAKAGSIMTGPLVAAAGVVVRLDTKLAGVSPAGYPNGMSSMSVVNTDGWPTTGLLRTFRDAVSNYTEQTLTERNTSPALRFFRVGNADGTAWLNWQRVTTGEPVAATAGFLASVESTSSTGFTDLSTLGPDVTYVAPASGKVLVEVSSSVWSDSSVRAGFMTYEVRNISTNALLHSAIEGRAYSAVGATAQGIANSGSRLTLIGSHVPGQQYTARAKYRASFGVASFADRRLTVINHIT